MTKNKKSFAIIISLIICICFALLLPFSAKTIAGQADDKKSLTDLQHNQIQSIIFEVAEREGYEFEELKYSEENIYYANETWAGYLVDFLAYENNGYLILFDVNGQLQTIELVFDKVSPYYGKPGKYIYPSIDNYIIKYEGNYYNASTWIPVDYTPENKDFFYAACNNNKTGILVKRELKYNYADDYYYDIPKFYYRYDANLTTHSNNCANAAGLILLNYWNKKYKNDLLKLDQSVLDIDGNISTNGSYDPRVEYMGIFYDYMKTNWIFGTGGTLPNNGYDGFERLIKEKGYRVNRYTSLNYSQMRVKIAEGIPILFTSTDYYFTTASTIPKPKSGTGNFTLTIDYERSYGIENGHTFVGYGYTFYTLIDANGKNNLEELFKVADGWGGTRYFNVTVSKIYSYAAIDVFN